MRILGVSALLHDPSAALPPGRTWRHHVGIAEDALPLHLAATGGLALTVAGALARRPVLAIVGALIWAGAAGAVLAQRLQLGAPDPAEAPPSRTGHDRGHDTGHDTGHAEAA